MGSGFCGSLGFRFCLSLDLVLAFGVMGALAVLAVTGLGAVAFFAIAALIGVPLLTLGRAIFIAFAVISAYKGHGSRGHKCH